ncbi:2-C-methyl-D-erythritol 4-phosphate cytidylyltransferase [Sphingobacterium alkalisoli]|uniref:2-C-methyl-D-erythritol 4-phosphate cytidylyltransferase n=1 Tax=Sphingobacterium alkalisoli TaxID=1874115 RepID=A0A4U0H5K1_9SPHI|nr:2-C-methyl-D-erythritol 4-phosphate cytidylyltransferase [Sphingobacterium alkalisoli]TJY67021.1 2-C-methyl-D-erythritol 4-phosphate cytidylyltransferase [Sphingobacterium alkalisoli]GGH12734.1 2-C-methyl-D-erythritol 4-phosphate cytidylyltransferase [Sphingobacterium alkalisoli]
MVNNIVIIVAGGAGSRMQSDIPKQYLLLEGRPILMHTLEVFAPLATHIIVVLHTEMERYWTTLCQSHQFSVKHDIVHSGLTRFQSVKNGLRYLKDKHSAISLQSAAIAVHDGARPLTDKILIKRSFEMAHMGKANVLAVQSTNSVRHGTIDNSKAIRRDSIWLTQTPQTFPAPLLMEAYEQKEQPDFTDDASVVEKMGNPIHLLESTHKNIKITFPEDIEIAQIYLKKMS